MIIAFAACGSSAGSGSGTVASEEWAGATIRMGVNETDEAFLREFADAVTEATGGKIKIETILYTTLGSGSDVYGMLRDGSLDMTFLSPANTEAGTFPVSAIADIPFFSTSPTASTEMFYTLKNLGYMDKEFEGIHHLFTFTSDGSRIAFVEKNPQTAEEFKGMVFRCMSAGVTHMLENLGASGSKISSSEIYMSMQRKVVDGSISSPSAMVKMSYQEVCDYLLGDVLYSQFSYVLCSQKFWDFVPLDYQMIINRVCEQYRYKYIQKNYTAEADGIAALQAGGMQVFYASPELNAAMHQASSDLLENYKKDLVTYGYTQAEADEIVSVCERVVARVDYNF